MSRSPLKVEVLDFDALVRKHVRIVPTCRSFQMSSWVPLSIALILPVVFVLGVIFDVVLYGLNIARFPLSDLQAVPILQFQVSHKFLHEQLFGEWLRNWWSLTGLAFGWPLSVFVTLSLVSFQIDRVTLTAFSLLGFWQTARTATVLVTDSLKWQGAFDGLEPIVEDVWLTGVFAYFGSFIFVTVFRLYVLSGHERSILREGGAGTRFSRSTILLAFGIPPNIRNSARRVRTALLAFLGNLIGFGPVISFVCAGGVVFLLFQVAARPFVYPVASSFYSNLIFSIIMFSLVLLFLIMLVILFRVVGNAGRRMSRRFMRVSLEQAQARDQRRPVLFLRSFRDDTVALAAPPSGFAYKLFGFADRNKTLDELLLEEGTTFGPVVALGNPSDPVPPYGAARGYAKHCDWQKMVSELMEAAAAIVICVDETPSLWWEIEHISRNAHLAKTLLLLHPKYGVKDGTSAAIRKIEQAFGLSLCGASLDRSQIFGLWLDAMMGLRVGIASGFSRAHYLLMLRWFLRSHEGS
jgi:hypothetical protein